MKIVGINIRKLREKKGLTLRELAMNMSVSASLLSQIETGKTSPSLATLKKVADALNITIGSLISDRQESPSQIIVRADERQKMDRGSKGMQMYLLTSDDPNKQMEPLLFKLEEKAGSGKETYKHFGQEFILILKGAMEITLNDTNYILKKGDTIYFNSSTPHSFRNINKGETEALWVVTPPTF